MEREGDALPEECITSILSRTTPLDSCVSKTFCCASQSDFVRDHFLPSDLPHLISRSDSQSSLLIRSRKSLYFTLYQNPIIIDSGTNSFQLDKKIGKKCYMLSAGSLTNGWGDSLDDSNWNWKSLRESRFPEVAEFTEEGWVDIHGVINTSSLSPKTRYSAYPAFKLIPGAFSHVHTLASTATTNNVESVKTLGTAHLHQVAWSREHRKVELLSSDLLDLSTDERQLEKNLARYNSFQHYVRTDGWLEIEIGDFKVSGRIESEMKMIFTEEEVEGGDWMSGIVVEGIEVKLSI